MKWLVVTKCATHSKTDAVGKSAELTNLPNPPTASGEARWLKALMLKGYLPRAPRRLHSLQQALFAYADAL